MTRRLATEIMPILPALLGFSFALNGSDLEVNVPFLVATTLVLVAPMAVPSRLTASWPWPRSVIPGAVRVVAAAVLLPLLGFSAAGHTGTFPWIVLPLLIGPTAVLEAVDKPDIIPAATVEDESRRDRLITIGGALLMNSSMIAWVFLFPQRTEIRLLSLAPAAIPAILSVAAVLHVNPEKGRRLVSGLAPLWYGFLLGFPLILNTLS